MGIVSIGAIILFGLILIMLETFLLAGTLVAGISGGILLVIGLMLAFSQLGVAIGSGVLIATIFATMILLFTAAKMMSNRNFGLQAAIDGKVNEVDILLVGVGDEGEAFGDLRLNGRARINNEVFDVESTGSYIDSGTTIKVVAVMGSKIMVEAIEDTSTKKQDLQLEG